MNIGIIGAGDVGGSLTRRFTALGHKVFVANSRGPETLKALAHETGATPVTVNEAARRGDVVIVTIPQKNIPDLPRDLFAGVPDMWSSSTPATIIRSSAMAALTGSRKAQPKAFG